ncbi:MAG: hypothetical protein QM755_18380, partial [Luteolibacter sp.]
RLIGKHDRIRTAPKKAGQTERDTLAAENQALRATLQQLDPLRERAEKAEQETAQVRQQLAALQKKGAEASGQVPESCRRSGGCGPICWNYRFHSSPGSGGLRYAR